MIFLHFTARMDALGTIHSPHPTSARGYFLFYSVANWSYLSISSCSGLAGSGRSTTGVISQLVFVVWGDCNGGRWMWLTRELPLNTKSVLKKTLLFATVHKKNTTLYTVLLYLIKHQHLPQAQLQTPKQPWMNGQQMPKTCHALLADFKAGLQYNQNQTLWFHPQAADRVLITEKIMLATG